MNLSASRTNPHQQSNPIRRFLIERSEFLIEMKTIRISCNPHKINQLHFLIEVWPPNAAISFRSKCAIVSAIAEEHAQPGKERVRGSSLSEQSGHQNIVARPKLLNVKDGGHKQSGHSPGTCRTTTNAESLNCATIIAHAATVERAARHAPRKAKWQ
jgi:hypothetical protein